ncbi:MAG: rod shape-determining protein MreC, partial [Candidatus Sulfotelmatobacter sp.]
SSGVGVFLEKSRLQGVLRGTPNGELILERVMSDEQVIPGEAVLSSGGDQIFPKGLPVGTVTKVAPGRDLFLSINVKPAADLSRLEEVLVVTQKEEREPVAQSGASVRAADILARRLPSVPDKPATVAGVVSAGNPGAKPQPNAAGKPATAPVTRWVAKPAPVSAAAGGATATTQPASGEVLKKVAQKPASGGSAAGSGPGSAAVSGTAAAASGTTSGATGVNSSSNSNSANSPAKPATPQPKPASPQTTPPPAATEDNPH